MAAYIVGLICGTITTIFPLVYLMSFDRSVANIMAQHPDFEPGRLNPSALTIASGVAAIGAVVLLVCAAMIALTGLKRLRAEARRPQSEPEPFAGAPEL